MNYVAASLALISLFEAALLLRSRRTRLDDRTDDRLAHFAEALALLTDTTEAGFANIATELQSGQRVSRTSSRGATAKRITTAVKRGATLGEIASKESLSESEIRLHLGLSSAEMKAAAESRPGAAGRW
jgi:hypothetical protein